MVMTRSRSLPSWVEDKQMHSLHRKCSKFEYPLPLTMNVTPQSNSTQQRQCPLSLVNGTCLPLSLGRWYLPCLHQHATLKSQCSAGLPKINSAKWCHNTEEPPPVGRRVCIYSRGSWVRRETIEQGLLKCQDCSWS